MVGTASVATAEPDGYTLVVSSIGGNIVSPAFHANAGFDGLRDFSHIAYLGGPPVVMFVHPSLGVTTYKDFVALARQSKEPTSYISPGTGSHGFLVAEYIAQRENYKVSHIPYKGVGPMVTDLLGGQIDFGVVALPSVHQHIKSGALRAIGACADKRTAAAPDIPTFVEQGLSGYTMEAWFAVIGPKGMAPALVKKVHDAVVVAFNDPGVKDTMAKQGNTISITSTEQAQKGFRTELAKYAALVKKAGIEPQ